VCAVAGPVCGGSEWRIVWRPPAIGEAGTEGGGGGGRRPTGEQTLAQNKPPSSEDPALLSGQRRPARWCPGRRYSTEF